MSVFQVVAQQAGGPEVLEIIPANMPEPGEGEILVEVAATGINFIETYRRAGLYPVEYPFVPGSECAGTVVKVGQGVTQFSVGDRVATMWGKKTYATHTVLDATKTVLLPDNVAFETAAAMLSQGITAHYLTASCYTAEQGDVAVVHAGAGGVGRLIIQMLKLRGATVIATTSTPEKAEVARQAGADHVIEYANFPAVVRELTDGEGASVVYDGVGKDTFIGSLESLKQRGTMVLFGGSSGPVEPFDPQLLNKYGSLYLTRPKTGDYLRTDEERNMRIKEVVELVSTGKLNIHVGTTFPLQDAGAAHAALENRQTTGKTILVP